MTKARSSLLLLTQTLDDLKLNLKHIIEESFKYTNENLYVYINPLKSSIKSSPIAFEPHLITENFKLKLLLNSFYQKSYKLNPNINVTCLLNNVHASHLKSKIRAKFEYDIILTDLAANSPVYSKIVPYCDENLPNSKFSDTIAIFTIDCIDQKSNSNTDSPNGDPILENDKIYANKVYHNSIMGGTFDRLHIGHKIMLSEAVLVTDNRLLIGVTTENMLKRKKLTELIQTYEVRCEALKKFLSVAAANLEILPVPISDPFGPSIVEKDYQCLVVSKETFKTGEMVNQKRVENHLSELEIHMVDLIKDSIIDEGDEEKVSSSNERRHLLGSLIKPPYIPYDESKPYVIGLTGGLASGKSTIGKDLEALGAGTINCDLLGHLTYEKDTKAYSNIIQTFGEDILDDQKLIDRKKLGAKVFNNTVELKKLTDIVWPEIQVLVDEQVTKLAGQGFKIIVVEAALLIDANWQVGMNEIWVCFVPDEEAIQRAVNRDGCSVEKAKGILSSQMSNKERISHANVVLSSLWEREYTKGQVQKAWSALLERTVNG